ncbi:MAG: aminodeoxychorismate synthase component I [Labilithrix sp.]|nr:aminodeoxychorismate synthase component I [Labilithrix sp.]
MPDMAFALHRWIVATSRTSPQSWLSVIGVGPSREDARVDAEARCAHVLRLLTEGAAGPRRAPPSQRHAALHRGDADATHRGDANATHRSDANATHRGDANATHRGDANATHRGDADATHRGDAGDAVTSAEDDLPTTRTRRDDDDATRASPRAVRDDRLPPPRVDATLSTAEYVARVARAKRHIDAGDAFEICLTNALRAPLARRHAWALFDELRRSNPAPFAALLDLPEGAVVSSSPERFLSLDARGIAESRPIKGTRPRGATPADDARLARELATAEKDRAENAMIVDLVRNDLGRVCRFGTVEAPELFVVEPYATVHQLVSTVRGELDAGKGAIDLLRACFPPGSMTGAPKIEAMRILERLEPVERGVYSGALGWIDLGGAMDLSVVIRTVVLEDDVARFSVGGAIVADSDPADEHEETEHKAFALVRALEATAAAEAPA